MAPKDYVARGRAPKKKTTPEKPVSNTPWGRIIVTLCLVAGFGYFLWSIKDSAPSSPQKTSVNKGQAQDDLEQLPEKPEEKWEFIEMLNDPEHTNVEVDVDEQGPLTQYQMQCGSFRTEEQAEKMRANIAFQGLESFVKKTNGSNGVWYRVVLGPYEGKRAAEKDRHTLQRAKFNTCQIWRWN